MATTVTRRVSEPNRVFAPAAYRQPVRWIPGNYLQLRLSPRFHLTDELALAADLRSFTKQADTYEATNATDPRVPSPQTLETETRRTIDDEGWMRTGDLGYLVDGEVFICGRAKDVIIVNGKNYYPQDLEWAGSEVPGVRAGNVVAFPSFKEGLGREAVVVVAETKEPRGHEEIARNVKTEIAKATGLTVDEVVIVDAGTIPKTSSGKLQRRKARAQYEDDALARKEDEGALKVAGRLVESQLAHLKLGIFGKK